MSALLVLAIIAVVLGAAGVLLVLRHRTHLRRAAASRAAGAGTASGAAAHRSETTRRLHLHRTATGRIGPEPTR